jgi:FAD/FMN-containing dehydrogenase
MIDTTVVSMSGHVVEEVRVQQFQELLHGLLLRPGDREYDTARRVWNGMIDKYPSLITFCGDEGDVINAVHFARENNLLTAVRSGGHNVAGNAVCDGGLVIDLSRMKQAQVSRASRNITVQAGLTLGELDHAAQSCDMAVPVGIVSKTGLAGLTLGGGIGWLMRKYGLTCDNLISADIVTAEGGLLKASAEENQDLFWGIRGGGGNFGIATQFTFRMHPLTMVTGGIVFYPAAGAREVCSRFRDLISAAPDELTTMLAFLRPPTPFLSDYRQEAPLIAVHVCHAGSPAEGEKAVKPLLSGLSPLRDMVGRIPYLEMQSMLDSGAPPGLYNYWKSCYLTSLDDTVCGVISEHFMHAPSFLTQIHIQHMQGAVSRVGEHDTAFSHRDALCVVNIVSKWTDPADSERNIQWSRELARALEPFSSGAYVNFMGDEGQDRVRAGYSSANYKRLVELKNRYDPFNLFSLNQNIRPDA